ncbi:MAG: hypothetical protein RLZZ196_295 [Bacteroidota bacterium]|jgi:hypothetical protein
MSDVKVKVNRIFKDSLLQERYESLIQQGVTAVATLGQESRLEKSNILAEKFFKSAKEKAQLSTKQKA